MAQMTLKRISDLSTQMRIQALQIVCGLWG
jgi:hypothetical protein